MLALTTIVFSASVSLWSATVPFTPGKDVTFDAHAGPLLLSTLEISESGHGKRAGATLTLTAANVGGKDADLVFIASLLDGQGAALATEKESAEIEEGDVRKVRFRIALPEGQAGPIASVKLEIVND